MGRMLMNGCVCRGYRDCSAWTEGIELSTIPPSHRTDLFSNGRKERQFRTQSRHISRRSSCLQSFVFYYFQNVAISCHCCCLRTGDNSEFVLFSLIWKAKTKKNLFQVIFHTLCPKTCTCTCTCTEYLVVYSTDPTIIPRSKSTNEYVPNKRRKMKKILFYPLPSPPCFAIYWLPTMLLATVRSTRMAETSPPRQEK